MSRLNVCAYLLGLLVLFLSSCAGNINGKGYQVEEIVSSDGKVYQIFEVNYNHKGLADANGDIVIKPKYSKIEYVHRPDVGDCCIVSYWGEVKYSKKERESSGYFGVEKRDVSMTGVYTVTGKKIFSNEYSDIDAYANDVFVTTSLPSISGSTTQTLYKGNDKVWVGTNIYVSKAGTCALGYARDHVRDESCHFFINPDTEKVFPLGYVSQYEMGENCFYYRLYGGTSGEVLGKNGEALVPEGVYDRIEIAAGDYIMCEIGNYECIYHISDMVKPCLQSEYRSFRRIKGAPGLFIVGELMSNSPYVSWDYYQYGVISASGKIVLPIIHYQIEVKNGNLILDYFNTSKDDIIKIEDLIARSNQ